MKKLPLKLRSFNINEPTPVRENFINKIGNFRMLTAGAGNTVFKINPNGIFAGAGKMSDAPFRLSYSGDLIANSLTSSNITATGGSIVGPTFKTAEPGAATGSSVTIAGGTNQSIQLYNNLTQVGLISGLQTAIGAETEYIKISSPVSGRFLSIRASKIACEGDFVPNTEFASSIGQSSQRWNEVWAKSIIASGTGAKFSINGSDGANASETGVTNFDITIIGGIITSFTKN